jgi:hypothetical protein
VIVGQIEQVDGDDVRVIELRGDARLAEEALALGLRRAVGQELERDRAPELRYTRPIPPRPITSKCRSVVLFTGGLASPRRGGASAPRLSRLPLATRPRSTIVAVPSPEGSGSTPGRTTTVSDIARILPPSAARRQVD